MRYQVEFHYDPYRPAFDVVDSHGRFHARVLATFIDIDYDGLAEKRANALAEELNAL